VKIGFNMFLWGPEISSVHRPVFEALKATGYDGVEIPVIGTGLAECAAMARILDDLGLERTTLTVLPPGHNPISEDKAEHAAAIAHLERCLDRSAALGSKLLVGPIHQTLNLFTGAAPTEAEYERCIAFHRAAGDLAAARGITVAAEAMNRFEAHLLNTMAQLVAYMDRVAHPAVTGMYDTFHANIEEEDLVAAVAPSLRRIAHVHVSESNRGVPGRGHVPFPAIFRALKAGRYDGWLTIEAFGRWAPEFASRTRVWRDFADRQEDFYKEGFRFVRDTWASA
jgi:D-psicose/D-tagatose/L-ribulose 3-epimerase